MPKDTIDPRLFFKSIHCKGHCKKTFHAIGSHTCFLCYECMCVRACAHMRLWKSVDFKSPCKIWGWIQNRRRSRKRVKECPLLMFNPFIELFINIYSQWLTKGTTENAINYNVIVLLDTFCGRAPCQDWQRTNLWWNKKRTCAAPLPPREWLVK